MIEKLKTLEDDEIDTSIGAVNTRFQDTELVRKINELIDAVNELGKDVCFLRRKVLELGYKEPETRAENVQPDAESRSENVLDEIEKAKKDGRVIFPNPKDVATALTKSLRMDKELAEAECVRLQNELERTRKALEIAVDALKEYADRDNWGMGFAPWLEDGFKDALYTEDGYKTAEKALEQITALEQKDVK